MRSSSNHLAAEWGELPGSGGGVTGAVTRGTVHFFSMFKNSDLLPSKEHLMSFKILSSHSVMLESKSFIEKLVPLKTSPVWSSIGLDVMLEALGSETTAQITPIMIFVVD